MEATLYFYLEPYVYYSVSPNGIILINLLDDNLLYFTDIASIKIIKTIQKSSKRVAIVEKDDLKIPLISQTILNFMGDIVKTDLVPLQFDSEINNLSGNEAYRKSIKFTRHDIGSLISECYLVSDYSTLTSIEFLSLLCGIDGLNEEMSIETVMSPSRVKGIIDEISEMNPSIKFFLTDPNIETLKSLLRNFPHSKNIIPLYSLDTLLENPNIHHYIEANNLFFKLIIHSFISLDKLNINRNNVTLMFPIKNEKDMENYERLKINGFNVEVYPVITKENTLFILSLFDWTLDDLKKLKDKYRTIKQNNLINSNIWGRIFVNPEGKFAFSPLDINNGISIGDNFFEFFHQTLIKGDFAWTRTRNYSQCRMCCFQYLCPSPSPIENYLRKKRIWKCKLINHPD